MTIGEQLLNLTVEYQSALAARDWEQQFPGGPQLRTPEVIAAEYEAVVRSLVPAS